MNDFLKKSGQVLMLLVLLCGSAWAVLPYTPMHPDPIKEPWRWQTFPEVDGSGLLCMAMGIDGTMWFGTNEGVVHYDGLEWTTYAVDDGLVGVPVNVLMVAKNGDVYAGSDEGISRFDSALASKQRSWQRIFPAQSDLPWSIYSLAETPDGHIWAGTAWGVLRLEPNQSVLYSIQEMIDVIRLLGAGADVKFELVPDHVVPVRNWRTGTGMRVVEGVEPISAVAWAIATNGPSDVAGVQVGDRITAVNWHPRVTNNQTDGGANTQVMLSVHRLGGADTLDVNVTRSNLSGTYRDFHVYSVFVDGTGKLWLGVGTRLHGGEIVSWNPQMGEGNLSAWKLYNNEEGVSLGFRSTVGQAENGDIWVVSRSGFGDAHRFDGQDWSAVSLAKLDETLGLNPPSWGNQNTSLLKVENDGLWMGGKGGRLHILRDGIWHVYAFPEIPFSQTNLIGLVDSKSGEVWVAGEGKIAARIDYGNESWQSYAGLHFQCELANGEQWFLSPDQKIVRRTGAVWRQFDADDGVISNPTMLFLDSQNELWAAGKHGEHASLVRFNGQGWGAIQTFPNFSQSFEGGVISFDSAGYLWLSAGGAWEESDRHLGGMLRLKLFDGSASVVNHYPPPDVPHYVFGVGQLADGAIIAGGSSLRRFDGVRWEAVLGPKELIRWGASVIGVGYTDRSQLVWLGTRNNGVYVTDGQNWTRYHSQHGLSDNAVQAITQTDDGSVWVATDKGISRFDGHTWTTHALPPELAPVAKHGLKIGRDGAIWINRSGTFETVRYVPDKAPPETKIVEWVDEVAQPGNVTIAWQGTDLWSRTASDEIQYAWRLDGGAWSAFESKTSKTLLEAGSGPHMFEVKARDRDFNEDLTPAAITFIVIPPVWQQPWFVGLMVALFGMIGLQTYRVITRDRRLQAANITLGEQNRDLSEARAAAEAASESKSSFLANMSHEIRTPLNAILGYARLLLRRDELAVDTRQSIGTIESSGTHLLTLINNILDLSRIESGRIELEQTDFDLMALAGDIQAMFAVSCQEKGIEWQVGWYDESGQALAAPEALNVYGDVGKLRQVLINLTGNAIKFAPGGHIDLRVSRLQDTHMPMHQNRYRFEVIDDGRGIHAEDQAAIFEPFEQGHHGSRAGGTGLGLAIARRYIQLMGGELDLASEVGRGSRFFFDLPLVPAEHAPLTEGMAAEKQVMALAEGFSLDVVVVDDVLENRQVLSQILISIGATVRLANNGLEALDVIAEKMPDIVLMDIWMPEMDGQAATRRIKAKYGDEAPPVVAVSASVLAHERTQFQAAGFDDFIAKPVHEGRLFATMAKFLHLEYLYQEDVDTRLNLDDVVLPDSLYNDLRQAAEFGEVTQLGDLVEQVRALGVSTHPLADQLWRLSRRLDLDAILKLLDEVKHGV
ncbi:MAG: signal transduction histidine kinase/DNA-binding response OmpR family regulator [Candidatus Latescibacterota bacterium]|jgi:signal transduction histidine kinase/DNA-binding response OmpR family regulator